MPITDSPETYFSLTTFPPRRRVNRNFIKSLLSTTCLLIPSAVHTNTSAQAQEVEGMGYDYLSDCFPDNPELRPTLSIGSLDSQNGPACVRAAEEILDLYFSDLNSKKLDIKPINVSVDSTFKGSTKAAVTELQEHFSLLDSPLGVVDQPTWQILQYIANIIPSSSPEGLDAYDVFILGASTFSHAKNKLPLHLVLNNLVSPDIAVFDRSDINAVGGTATLVGENSLLKRMKREVAKGRIPNFVIASAFSNDLTSNARWVIRNVFNNNRPTKNLTQDDYKQAYKYIVSQFLEYTDSLPNHPVVTWVIPDVNSDNRKYRNYNYDEWFSDAMYELKDERSTKGKTLHLLDWQNWAEKHTRDFAADGIHQSKIGLGRLALCLGAVINNLPNASENTAFDCSQYSGQTPNRLISNQG